MNIKLMEKYEPQVYISKVAYDKTMEYINQSKKEIGWLATAVRVKEGFYIEDTYLFKQEVEATTTEIKEEGLNEFAMELMQQPDGMDIWNKMRVWGHSHVNMSTSPSTQDNSQMKLFLENPNDFFIRIIGNKSEDFKIDIWDFKSGIIYENAEFVIVYDEKTEEILNAINKQIMALRNKMEEMLKTPAELQEQIKKEISEKVKEKTYKNIYGKQPRVSIYDDYDDYYGYGYGYGYNNYGSSKKKETRKDVIDKGEELFNTLSQEEIFIIMEEIECGGTCEDVLGVEQTKGMTKRDFTTIDDLVSEYCNACQNDYMNYIMENYGY